MTRDRDARQLRLGFAVSLAAITALVPPSASQAADEKELVIFAAASLREALSSMAAVFESAHAGAKVRLHVGGSQELRFQIEQGAGADVFASADEKQMAVLVNKGLVQTTPFIFAGNVPVVVVPAHASAASTGLASFLDLPKAQRIVLGAPEVPIGAYSDAILSAADRHYGNGFRSEVLAKVRSRELNVKQVLAKVALAEADAGIVYRSDALAANGRVRVIRIPDQVNVTAQYPIAMLASTTRPMLARALLDLIRSEQGQNILRASGLVPAGVLQKGKGGP